MLASKAAIHWLGYFADGNGVSHGIMLVVGFILGGGLVLLWCGRWMKRARREQADRDRIAESLIHSQERERKRMAADLHDGLGQNLLLIKNRAVLAMEGPPESRDAQFQLEEISRVASESLDDIRKISRNLRPYQLDRLGLTKALQAVVRAAFDSSSIQINGDIDDLDGILSPEDEINLYRILQEGLNNVLKHSEAAHTKVAVKRSLGGVKMIIEDDGVGVNGNISDASRGKGCGLGLTIMMERARILGGQFQIQSLAQGGTRIQLSLPANEGDHGTKNQSNHRG